MTVATPSGIEWFTAMKSKPNSPRLTWLPALISRRRGFLMPCLCELALDEAEGELGAEDRASVVPTSLSRYGSAPVWSS